MFSSFCQRRQRRRLYAHILLVRAALFLLASTARGKEIIATYEWQKLGPTDTVPAGLEIRMDLGGGGTWVRLPPSPPPFEESAAANNEPNHQQQQRQQQGEVLTVPVHHKDRCGPSCKERQKERAEIRRAAGFRLRAGPTHKDYTMMDSIISPNDNDNNSTGITFILLRVGIFIILGLTIGVGVTSRLRTRRNANNGFHEH